MPNIGPMELAIVLIIALMIFGPRKLPELGNSLGRGIREFKGTINGEDGDERSEQESPRAITSATETDQQEPAKAPAGSISA